MKQLLALAPILFLPLFAAAQPKVKSKAASNLISFVSPFIGTDAHGHTFPGATAPFGMVQLSPDTRLDMRDWDGCSGYHYSDSIVYGFSHTHLSGTGVPDYCDVLFMPFTGKMETEPKAYGSHFKKEKEFAGPGFYSVFLEKYRTLVELTATERVGVHRYTYPMNIENAYLLVDLRHRDLVLDSHLEVVNDREIAGYRVSRAWAQEQHVYFVARFSRPFVNPRVLDMAGDPAVSLRTATSKSVVGILNFQNNVEPVVVTVGISAVSMEGARKNLEAEVRAFDFEKILAETQSKWEHKLSKIEVEGGTEQQRVAFYTGLYHTMIQPNIFNDVDGQYRGRDKKIHTAKGHDVYTVFSLWDTYRAANPLYTILEPRRTGEFVQTFLRQFEQAGLLPIWELGANETDCMIGNHAIPVITDAWLKGIRNYDGSLALHAMMTSANQERYGFDLYRKLGFIPSEKEPESVSKTLEYTFDDWVISLMANDLGKKEVSAEFARRAKNYRNLFDPSTGFFRAKNNSTWYSPFDPFEVNFNYTEANAWQYRFAATQDVAGMMRLHGGRERFAAQLDSLFTASDRVAGRKQADITGLIGQYVQGNEPSHHMAYLYNFAGQPWKTQERIRQIVKELYTDQPDGLSGNEDCGQMSAWYVFSAMGFYPAVPVGGQYVIGTPVFKKISIRLDNGRIFVVRADGLTPEKFYVKNARINNRSWSKTWFSHEQLLEGGELTLDMTDKPSDWGKKEADCPMTAIEGAEWPSIPFVKKGERVFRTSQKVELGCLDADAKIFYTLDGSVPTSQSKVYKKSFTVKTTTKVKAIAIRNGLESAVMEADFGKMQPGLKVARYNTKYSPQYTGRGDEGLIDQLRGGNDFRSGGWQGYEGSNLDVVLDLGSKKPVHSIAAGFLQDENAWIFFPDKVQFEISDDGQNFRPVGEQKPTIQDWLPGSHLHDFQQTLPTGTEARYVRVVGVSKINCPSWHKGAGNPCWLMVDEVLVD